MLQSGTPQVFESDWNTGYCEGSNKVVGLERSQVHWEEWKRQGWFHARRALEWSLEQ